MICTTIAQKYYFKWHETFPENAQNNENQTFRDVFGSEDQVFIIAQNNENQTFREVFGSQHQFRIRTFGIINSIFNDSLFTKAILN
uniref:Uncharacterized protein n=1 Tax=Panagrolaimus sp. PS1159 TaxID=55785 RepID=A0AC35FFH5_9BILA